jgi:hypothetical protein
MHLGRRQHLLYPALEDWAWGAVMERLAGVGPEQTPPPVTAALPRPPEAEEETGIVSIVKKRSVAKIIGWC